MKMFLMQYQFIKSCITATVWVFKTDRSAMFGATLNLHGYKCQTTVFLENWKMVVNS